MPFGQFFCHGGGRAWESHKQKRGDRLRRLKILIKIIIMMLSTITT